MPKPGEIVIFNRSHYEDVLIARVKGLASPAVVRKRYAIINRFEAARERRHWTAYQRATPSRSAGALQPHLPGTSFQRTASGIGIGL